MYTLSRTQTGICEKAKPIKHTPADLNVDTDQECGVNTGVAEIRASHLEIKGGKTDFLL